MGLPARSINSIVAPYTSSLLASGAKRILATLTVVVACVAVVGAGAAPDVCVRRWSDRECWSYPITEFVFAPALVENDGIDHVVTADWTLGWMFDLSDRFGLAPTLLIGIDARGGGFHWGTLLRMRVYLPHDFHSDLAPGVMVANESWSEEVGGVMLEFGFGWRDWISLYTRVETRRYGYPPTNWLTSWYLGARTGSYTGAAIGGAVLLAVGIGFVASRN